MIDLQLCMTLCFISAWRLSFFLRTSSLRGRCRVTWIAAARGSRYGIKTWRVFRKRRGAGLQLYCMNTSCKCNLYIATSRRERSPDTTRTRQARRPRLVVGPRVGYRSAAGLGATAVPKCSVAATAAKSPSPPSSPCRLASSSLSAVASRARSKCASRESHSSRADV